MFRAIFLFLIVLFTAAPAFSANELIMFNSSTCEWCEVWEEEVGGVYGKTEVGKTLPVHRVDIHEDRPVNLEHLRGIRFTPTFVLLQDGREVGRITGYPGESFFWGLLEEMTTRIDPLAGACDDKNRIAANATLQKKGEATC